MAGGKVKWGDWGVHAGGGGSDNQVEVGGTRVLGQPLEQVRGGGCHQLMGGGGQLVGVGHHQHTEIK